MLKQIGDKTTSADLGWEGLEKTQPGEFTRQILHIRSKVQCVSCWEHSRISHVAGGSCRGWSSRPLAQGKSPRQHATPQGAELPTGLGELPPGFNEGRLSLCFSLLHMALLICHMSQGTLSPTLDFGLPAFGIMGQVNPHFQK